MFWWRPSLALKVCIIHVPVLWFLLRQTISQEKALEEVNITDWNSILKNFTKHLDCRGKFNKKEVYMELQNFLSVDQVIQRTKNCSQYFTVLQPTYFLSKEYNIKEANNPNGVMYHQNFSMAFAHLAHDEPGIFELFMLLYFRPYNSHCLHIDTKAEPAVQHALKGIFTCYKEMFPHARLFLAQPSIPVYWGHISLLDADLTCAKQAVEVEHKGFDVYVNVAGTELPTWPYEDFEYVMQEVGVKNIVQSDPMEKRFEHRMNYSHYLSTTLPISSTYQPGNVLRNSTKHKTLPPHSIELFKGVKNVMLNRTTVEFMLYDKISVDFYNWLRDALVPEEHFYASLIRLNALNPSHKLVSDEQTLFDTQNGICPRETLRKKYHRCGGFRRNGICVLGLTDLKAARDGLCLVLNKFSAAQVSSVGGAICHFLHVIKLWEMEFAHPLLKSFLEHTGSKLPK